MSKFLVALLATMAALWLIAIAVGSGKMGETAFHLPHFGTPISWALVVGGVLGVAIWRIVKGK